MACDDVDIPGDSGTPAPLLVDRKTASAMLAVSERMLAKLTVPYGPIPRIKIGAAVRYVPADLEAFITSRREIEP